jgi:NodT family efflux transporter outer membrane factor (OMF) lipoprotein
MVQFRFKKEFTLRLYLICTVTLLSLAGCVNYAGMHEHAIPLNDTMLSATYSENSNQKHSTENSNWWDIFSDTELNKIVETALSDSPNIQMAQTRIEEAAHIADQSRSTLWPSVNASGDISRERITSNGIYPPPYGGNTYTETVVGLNFQYEFDFWGKNREALAANISEKRAREADYAEARLVLAAAVTNQYFQLQYDVAALKISDAILRQRQAILNIIQARSSHGVESDIPLSTANAEMEAAKINRVALAEQIKLSQHALAALMGKNPFNSEITPNKFRYQKKLLVLPKVLRANLLGRRPDIVASRWRIEEAAERVNVAKARFYPNINLIGILSLQSYTLSKTFYSSSRDDSIGAAIDLPIFDANARRANLATRFDEYDMASEQYNQAILTALRDVADQAATLSSLSKQEAQQTAALQASQQSYSLTLARYKHGINDYMSVLEIQNALLQAEYRQTQLRALHLKAAVSMIKALGGNYPREG